MEQYISKSALVAEIERIKHETNYEPFTGEVLGKRYVCGSLLSFLDTLEVKEVDLEEKISFKWSKYCLSGKDKDSFAKIAKYFFELSLNISNYKSP